MVAVLRGFFTSSVWAWMWVRLLVFAGVVASLGGCATMYGPGAGFFNTVVVDAGHGGHDRGARSVRGKNEKELCLDTAQRLAPLLREAGFRVVMTRTSDRFVPLSERVEEARLARNSVFVSLHYNWSRRRRARGMETFYYEGSPQSRRLAANIQKEILRAYPTVNRGVKTARFYVLRNNPRPAVLVELGFLSNPEDNAFVQRPEVRQRLAEAVARGIVAEREGRVPRF